MLVVMMVCLFCTHSSRPLSVPLPTGTVAPAGVDKGGKGAEWWQQQRGQCSNQGFYGTADADRALLQYRHHQG